MTDWSFSEIQNQGNWNWCSICHWLSSINHELDYFVTRLSLSVMDRILECIPTITITNTGVKVSVINSSKREHFYLSFFIQVSRDINLAWWTMPNSLRGEKNWKLSNNLHITNVCWLPVLQKEKYWYQIYVAKVQLTTERFCFQSFKVHRNNSFHSRMRKAKWCIPYMQHE